MIIATVTFAVPRNSSPWSNFDPSYHEQDDSSLFSDEFEDPEDIHQHTLNASTHESPWSTNSINQNELEHAKIAIENTLFCHSNLMAMLFSEITPVTSSPFAHHSISSHSMENDTPLYQCEIQLSATNYNQVITKTDIETFFVALKNEADVNEAQLINYRIDESFLSDLTSARTMAAPTKTSPSTHDLKVTPFQQCRQISGTINRHASQAAKWHVQQPTTGKYSGFTVRLFKCKNPNEAERIKIALQQQQFDTDILPGKTTGKAQWVAFKHR